MTAGRATIEQCLAGSSMPADLAAAAAARVEARLLAAWFKMPLRLAAVLVPLIDRTDGLQVLLTERTHSVSDHPGQVAFPGGSVEPADADLAATALRESHEEIGLHPEQVEVVGFLPPQAVISGFAVQPVVGFCAPDFEPVLDAREVAAVFEVPLAFLQDPANLIRIDRVRRGVTLPTYEFHFEGHRIWGATALMIRLLLDKLDSHARTAASG